MNKLHQLASRIARAGELRVEETQRQQIEKDELDLYPLAYIEYVEGDDNEMLDFYESNNMEYVDEFAREINQ